MASEFKLFWTEEAISNLESILTYISSEWTGREFINFKKIISRQIQLIGQFPLIFPGSIYNPRLRKAVLSKQTIIFYEVKNQIIYIVFLFNTRQNPEKFK